MFEGIGVVVITTAQLHSTKPELWFCACSNPARGVSEIRDGEDLWQWSLLEIRLNTFRRSTIPQKQFIIIIWRWPVINLITLVNGYSFLISLEIDVSYRKLRLSRNPDQFKCVLEKTRYHVSIGEPLNMECLEPSCKISPNT